MIANRSFCGREEDFSSASSTVLAQFGESRLEFRRGSFSDRSLRQPRD